jgi:hypothetical protein
VNHQNNLVCLKMDREKPERGSILLPSAVQSEMPPNSPQARAHTHTPRLHCIYCICVWKVPFGFLSPLLPPTLGLAAVEPSPVPRFAICTYGYVPSEVSSLTPGVSRHLTSSLAGHLATDRFVPRSGHVCYCTQHESDQGDKRQPGDWEHM